MTRARAGRWRHGAPLPRATASGEGAQAGGAQAGGAQAGGAQGGGAQGGGEVGARLGYLAAQAHAAMRQGPCWRVSTKVKLPASVVGLPFTVRAISAGMTA